MKSIENFAKRPSVALETFFRSCSSSLGCIGKTRAARHCLCGRLAAWEGCLRKNLDWRFGKLLWRFGKDLGLLVCLLILFYSGGNDIYGEIRGSAVPSVTREITTSDRDAGQYKEGELLIRFKRGTTAAEAMAVIEQLCARIIGYNEQLEVYLVKLRRGQTVEDGRKDFSARPEVQFAEPNYIMRKP